MGSKRLENSKSSLLVGRLREMVDLPGRPIPSSSEYARDIVDSMERILGRDYELIPPEDLITQLEMQYSGEVGGEGETYHGLSHGLLPSTLQELGERLQELQQRFVEIVTLYHRELDADDPLEKQIELVHAYFNILLEMIKAETPVDQTGKQLTNLALYVHGDERPVPSGLELSIGQTSEVTGQWKLWREDVWLLAHQGWENIQKYLNPVSNRLELETQFATLAYYLTEFRENPEVILSDVEEDIVEKLECLATILAPNLLVVDSDEANGILKKAVHEIRDSSTGKAPKKAAIDELFKNHEPHSRYLRKQWELILASPVFMDYSITSAEGA